MRTISEMATRLDVPWCGGGCGLSKTKHREGCLFLGVVHFADRRFTRRAARNLLLLVARMKRESDDQYLNHEVYDWWYLYHDAVTAAKMAMACGVRLPASVFDHDREMCRLLATKRGVKLSRYHRVYEWTRA